MKAISTACEETFRNETFTYFENAQTLCYSFVGTYECFGASVEVPLKEGGENIIVNNENRGEYVQLYIDWYLNQSIKDKFRSFKKGFARCLDTKEKKDGGSSSAAGGGATTPAEEKTQNMFFSLFRPDELETLICGSESLDFDEFQKNTSYEGGYDAKSEPIVWFWEIVKEYLSCSLYDVALNQ